MSQLDFARKEKAPYRFMGAMLAPKGAFYTEYAGKDVAFFPVMYIQLWEDPNGTVWNVPLWSEEIQGFFDDDHRSYQEYIEDVINEDRRIQTCLTCWDFILLCRQSDNISREDISLVMENMCQEVIRGEIGTTPELREYFKNGVWGDLRTMDNDGSLDADWMIDELTANGAISPDTDE